MHFGVRADAIILVADRDYLMSLHGFTFCRLYQSAYSRALALT
jgi:hypothetical protein